MKISLYVTCGTAALGISDYVLLCLVLIANFTCTLYLSLLIIYVYGMLTNFFCGLPKHPAANGSQRLCLCQRLFNITQIISAENVSEFLVSGTLTRSRLILIYAYIYEAS